MTDPLFEPRPTPGAISSPDHKSLPPTADTEAVLSRQLSQGRDYLERHLRLLPDPYPGCILFFTVAARNQASSAFHVRGTTLDAAWREGATRIRQWAWARQQRTVELRIDWVRDIIALQAGHAPAFTIDPGKHWALADAELEHPQRLQLPPPDGGTAPSAPTLRLPEAFQELPPDAIVLLLNLKRLRLEDGPAPTRTSLCRMAPGCSSAMRNACRPPAAASLPADRQGMAPMSWDSDALARIMHGSWVHLPPATAPLTCAGLDSQRQHHLAGAAVLLRQAGLPMGVPPAALPALQASALICQSPPRGLPPHHFPILQVADLQEGLSRLAHAARQRIQAPVIAATGCAGKTATLGMLRRCLQGTDNPRADALLTQSPALQMINWSEAAACVLIELPLATLASDLPICRPDIFIITDTDAEGLHAPGASARASGFLLQAARKLVDIRKTIPLLQPGATVVIPHSFGSDALLMAIAREAGVRIVTFGPEAGAHVREQSFAQGRLRLATQQRELELHLQSDGHHMARNAQAALAALYSLGRELPAALAPLESWQPLPGMGQPQCLPHGICLLDHSQSSHLVSMQAAFSQLQAHAAYASNRVIALAGIQPCTSELETSQLLLEPMIRATPAKCVLLYGDALRELASALEDLPHVHWYDDLNQLVYFLLRTAQRDDTVLLAGRATTHLAIAADALRENIPEGQQANIYRPDY